VPVRRRRYVPQRPTTVEHDTRGQRDGAEARPDRPIA
jgi:hypothetical protein